MGKRSASRRYNQLPLLRSSPGGFEGSWPYRTFPFACAKVDKITVPRKFLLHKITKSCAEAILHCLVAAIFRDSGQFVFLCTILTRPAASNFLAYTLITCRLHDVERCFADKHFGHDRENSLPLWTYPKFPENFSTAPAALSFPYRFLNTGAVSPGLRSTAALRLFFTIQPIYKDCRGDEAPEVRWNVGPSQRLGCREHQKQTKRRRRGRSPEDSPITSPRLQKKRTYPSETGRTGQKMRLGGAENQEDEAENPHRDATKFTPRCERNDTLM